MTRGTGDRTTQELEGVGEAASKQLADADVEKAAAASGPEAGGQAAILDIEHAPVEDDPRKWSAGAKWFQFFFISYAAMAAALSANIILAPIESLKRDLGASQTVINLSVSLFVLLQGLMPTIWSAISEIYGRKIVYMIAYSIFTVSQIICSVSQNQILFLVFRVVGACGSSAGLVIGGANLADLYEKEERGTKIGIYYMFPLLGPSVGTLLGGALTLTSPGWRSSFYFTAAYGATCVVWTYFCKETFRKERSIAWNKAYNRAVRVAKAKDEQTSTSSTIKPKPWSRTGTRSPTLVDSQVPEPVQLPQEGLTGGRPLVRKITTRTGEEVPIKIHLADINPLSASKTVMKQAANSVAIIASGILFGAQYTVAYTGALSFAAAPYSYNSLDVGLILLSFGVGNIIGSVLGGRYSDIVLRRLKQQNNGQVIAEWRLRASLAAMPLIPVSFIAYAWTVDKTVPIYGPCIALFLAGFSSIWVYSCCLAYIVDSSVGMVSSAVACNSAARGIFGFLGSETAEPLLNAIGNGWLYTMWTFIQMLALAGLIVVCWRGYQWRTRAAEKLAAKSVGP